MTGWRHSSRPTSPGQRRRVRDEGRVRLMTLAATRRRDTAYQRIATTRGPQMQRSRAALAVGARAADQVKAITPSDAVATRCSETMRRTQRSSSETEARPPKSARPPSSGPTLRATSALTPGTSTGRRVGRAPTAAFGDLARNRGRSCLPAAVRDSGLSLALPQGSNTTPPS